MLVWVKTLTENNITNGLEDCNLLGAEDSVASSAYNAVQESRA